MDKRIKKYVKDVFVVKMSQIGFEVISWERNNINFNYKNLGKLNFSYDGKHVQGILYNNFHKRILSFRYFYLLGCVYNEAEKMENADDIFYYDDFFEFEGILNYIYLTLEKNAALFFTAEGFELVQERIKASVQQFQQKYGKQPEKESFIELFNKRMEWVNHIRFTEDFYHVI